MKFISNIIESVKKAKEAISKLIAHIKSDGFKGAIHELLKSVTFQTGVGIYLDREWLLLFVAEVAQTPVGNVLVREDIVPILEQEDGEPIQIDKDGNGVPAAVGIASKDVFYTVDDARQKKKKKKKEKDLLTIMEESDGDHSLASDTLNMNIQNREVLARVACRSAAVDAIRPYCAKAGYDIAYCEPAGMSALRASYEFSPRPGKNVCQLRILLGPQEGLAALLFGNYILAYETIAKPDNRAVKRTVRFLEQFATSRAFCPDIDEILIMGDRAGIDWLDTEEISSIPTTTCEAKPYGELIAWGLALRLLSTEQNDVNLAVTVKQILPLKEAISRVVRIWEIGAVILLIGGLWFYQDYQRMNLEDHLAAMKRRLKGYSVELRQLKRKELEAKVTELEVNTDKYQRFLKKRMSWAAIFAGTAGLLPEGAVVSSINSQDNFTKSASKKGKGKGRRYFELALVMQAQDKALRAQQVDTLIQQMRASSLISKHFKNVQLAGPVEWITAGGRLREARLTIVCTEK